MKYRFRTISLFLFGSIISINGFQNCSKFSVSQQIDNLNHNDSGSESDGLASVGLLPSIKFQAVSQIPLPGEFAVSSSSSVGSTSNVELNLGAAASPSQGLEFFGYPMLYSDPQVADEVRAHSNAVSLIFDPNQMPSEEKFKEMIRLSSSNFRMVIFVDGAFYSKTSGQMFSAETRNRNLQKLKELLSGYEQNILAIGFDEPIWNRQFWACGGGWNNCTEQVLSQGPTGSLVDSAVLFLELAGVAIKTYFPGASLIHIEGGPMVRTFTKFPKNYDYFGFDCYRKFDDCWGREIPTVFSILREHVVQLNRTYGGYRRLAIVPEAQLALDRKAANPTQGQVARDEAESLSLFNKYLNLISSDPMVKIMGVWIWQTFQDNDVISVGARTMPTLRERLKSIGAEITKKTPLAQRSRPVVRLHVSPGVKVGERALWVWSAPGANYCRSITEPSAFPRMEPQGFFAGPVESAARSITYTIECVNEEGAVRESIEYAVTDSVSSNALQPPSLYLAQTSFEFTQNQSIPTIQMVNIGGAIQSCRASPSLPPGLTLSPLNCGLGGTPTSTSAVRAFQIIATNSAGQSILSLNISVVNSGGSGEGDQTPGPTNSVFCEAVSRQIDSLTNSVGVRNTCHFQVPRTAHLAARTPFLADADSSSAIYKVICEANGQYSIVQTYCPAPSDPVPPAVFCEQRQVSFQSAANSVGDKNTCTTDIPRLDYLPTTPVYTSTVIPAEGRYKVKCGADGQHTIIESFCPAPRNPIAAAFTCNVTNPSIKSFSFSGQAIPASNQRGLKGNYFAGGYDPNEGVWFSFDGATFHKHSTLNSEVYAISTKNILDDSGLGGELFRNHDLSIFPNGRIYIGYGAGATKEQAFANMISQRTFQFCHTLVP